MTKTASETKTKTKKNETKTKITVEETVTQEPVTTESPISEIPIDTTVDESDESNTEILFNKLNNQFQDVLSVMKTLHSNLKVLQKEVLRERKESKKKESKIKKKSDKKRSPSGFAMPAPISEELANFLGLQVGSELARTEVTSKVIAYVKECNLQNPEKKKEIIPDEKLNKLLTPAEGEVITFFNLQTHLKRHFGPIKKTVTESVTVV
jgi:chromatin remodeling complex protein RSC6